MCRIIEIVVASAGRLLRSTVAWHVVFLQSHDVPSGQPHPPGGQPAQSVPELIRSALLAQHERWAGTPYRIGGTGRNGIDCSALVQNVFSETFRLQLPRSTSEQVREGTQVSRDELQVGDLVFFRPPGRYDHVGIYVGDGYFLHASTSQGVMLSELDSNYWRRYYWQARRTLEPTTLAQRVTEPGEG
ncbi:C40 family peptidase [Billgrantia tianxiuensis]|uniref:C40 family peptidase n=1 Tax=Billgrantia tianxiuensis TaxID=2497861 RepID=UPI0030EEE433